MKKNDENNRILWVDGLKGIACLMVFVHHFLLAFYPASYYGASVPSHIYGDIAYSFHPVSFITNGSFLVMVFCLLSGFVLTYSFKNSPKKVICEAVKRYFRLSLPVFVISFFVLCIYKAGLFSNVSVVGITGSKDWLGVLYSEKLTFENLFSTSFYKVWFLGDITYSTAFWMLKYMFYGSVLCYVVNAVVFKAEKKTIWILPVLIIVFAVFKCYMALFLIGMLFAKLRMYFNFKNKKYLTVSGIILILVGAYSGGFPTGREPGRFYAFWGLTDYYYPHLFGTFCLVLGIMLCSYAERFFSNKIFLFLGKISYSVYLVHIPVLLSLGTALFSFLYGKNSKYVIDTVIVFFVTVVVLIVLSFLFSAFIEKPINRMINKVFEFKREKTK